MSGNRELTAPECTGGCGSHHAAPNHTIYDHSQPAMRAAWVENIVKVVQANLGDVDGVFCDRSGPITAVSPCAGRLHCFRSHSNSNMLIHPARRQVMAKDLFCYEFEEGFAQSWDIGRWQAVADTQAAPAVGETVILLHPALHLVGLSIGA